jgi:hypothetical protein
MKKMLIGLLAGLGLVATLAIAQSNYVGWNPATGLTGVLGVPVATGPLPTVTGCSQSAVVGGGSVVQVTAGATSCTLTVTIPAAAPNGVFCVFIDETHPADLMAQASHTTATCVSSTGTVTSGDKILVEINAF